MEIEIQDISECPDCGNFRGQVTEKYNGNIPVYCQCDLNKLTADKKNFNSPSMVSPDGKQLWWTPISNHKEADGEMIHTPYFGGPALVHRKKK